jgi:hypothetical protein
LIIVAGKGSESARKVYGCSQHANRGACSNGLRIEKCVIEKNLFGALQASVLTPDFVDYTIREFTRRTLEKRGRATDEQAFLRRRLGEIERELGRLSAAIAETSHSRALLDAIRDREHERYDVERKLHSADCDAIQHHPGSIRDFVVDGLRDLLGLISSDVSRARAQLAKYTSEIRLVPEVDEIGKVCYIAEGGWNLFGRLD